MIRSFGEIGNVMGVWILLRIGVFAFLGANLWYRFSTIFDYSEFIGGLFVLLAAFSLLVILYPGLLRAFLFFFGASFFLFGFRAYDIQGQVFETVVVFVAITMFVVNLRSKESLTRNRRLMDLILCYIGLSAFSLVLLPVGHILRDLWFFGLEASAQQFANATPNSPLYALGGFNRLALFSIMSFQLTATRNFPENFKLLFAGIFSGAVFCAIIGLLDFSGVISLQWYRLGTTHIQGVLHSTFLNRGWFSEFILSAVPFVLIGFISQIKYRWWKIMLFVFLVICEVVLILSGARAGWISYPLVLFICWLFFYFTKEGGIKKAQFRWWNLIKVAVSVPITIAISLLFVFQVVLPLSDALRDKADVKSKGKDSAVTTEYLKKKAATMITASASSRPMRWKQGFNVGRENLGFGMGYESFRWHADILPGVEGSYCNRNVTTSFADTPHCTFYQLFVSGGIVGLCLWMTIILYAMTILIVDLIKNQRLLNIPVVISIISFHMYGIFQSMQYIPMIWSLIFLCLGYTMTIDDGVLPDRIRRFSGILVKVCVIMVAIGAFVYLFDSGSRSLAEKYGLKIYAKDQARDNYLGFYHQEKGPHGNLRWSGEKGLIKVQGNGLVALRFVCNTPGVEKEPVTVNVSVDEECVDKLVFREKGEKKWHYWLDKGRRTGGGSQESGVRKRQGTGKDRGRKSEVTPVEHPEREPGSTGQGGQERTEGAESEKEHEILVEVSRTWNPRREMGSADNRYLGVIVTEPKFLKKLPKDGIGFYHWERLEGKERRFRWTGRRASVPMRMAQSAERGAERAERRAQGATNGTNGHELGEKGKVAIAERAEGREQSGERNADWGKRGDGRELTVFLWCSHPDIEEEGVGVKILGDGVLLRGIEFGDHGMKRVVLGEEELRGKEVLTFEVSRTWNPKRMGVSQDNRDLGVAVAIP